MDYNTKRSSKHRGKMGSSVNSLNTSQKVRNIKSLNYQEIITIPPMRADQVRRPQKHVSRKLKSWVLFYNHAGAPPSDLNNMYGYNQHEASYEDVYSQNVNSFTVKDYHYEQHIADPNAPNWECIDLGDPKVIMQGFYGQNEADNDNLQPIEEVEAEEAAVEGEAVDNSEKTYETYFEFEGAIPPNPSNTIVCEGILKKFNSKGSKYKKRWCILTETTFGYFKHKNDTTPLFAIELKSIYKIVRR